MFLFVYIREINGFSICFKQGDLSATVGGKVTSIDSTADKDKVESPAQPERQISVHTVLVQPLDDVMFKLNEKNDAKSLLEKVAIAIAGI